MLLHSYIFHINLPLVPPGAVSGGGAGHESQLVRVQTLLLYPCILFSKYTNKRKGAPEMEGEKYIL